MKLRLPNLPKFKLFVEDQTMGLATDVTAKADTLDLFCAANEQVVAVYLFCKLRKHQYSDKLFSGKQVQLSEELQQFPIFLTEEHALDYARYVGKCTAIKVYVDPSLIVASDAELRLKKVAFSHQQVHGCYQMNGRITSYIENPHFAL